MITQTTFPRMTDQEPGLRFKYVFLLAACFLLSFSSCDDSFQPLQENDKYYFSIYGFIDAAADTQWIRASTARQDINEPANPSAIKVTLENLQNGESSILKDTLFAPGDILNYWTTMPIENEQTYRIKAERDDGKSSEVMVTIPGEMPTPLVIENRNFPPYGSFIYIDDSIEHLADVQSKWYVLINPLTERLKKTYTFTYRNEIQHTEVNGGVNFAFSNMTDELDYITRNNTNAEILVLNRQFFVASAGPEWDDNISSIDDLEYFLNGTASNVENGLGYVIGIDSKWMSYDSCFTADRSNVIPCEPENPFW